MPDPTTDPITILTILDHALPGITAIIGAALLAWITHSYALKQVRAAVELESYHKRQVDTLSILYSKISIVERALRREDGPSEESVEALYDLNNYFADNIVFIDPEKIRPGVVEIIANLAILHDPEGEQVLGLEGIDMQGIPYSEIYNHIEEHLPDLLEDVDNAIRGIITP